MTMPSILFVAGKKLAGKDFICDALVREAGYHKFHLVKPWLVQFCARHGISWEQYESEKAKWRSVIQDEASAARANDPEVLIKAFREALPTLPRPLCVTAVRFEREAALGFDIGAMVVRVTTPDPIRWKRFIAAGENTDLFVDPFEREVDTMPVHLEIPGCLMASEYPTIIADAYQQLGLNDAGRLS